MLKGTIIVYFVWKTDEIKLYQQTAFEQKLLISDITKEFKKKMKILVMSTNSITRGSSEVNFL